ncbi:alpha/beta fold hydrolase [Limimaricola cinnabarinus]|jgi:pimeloyl-ACP methyl ester carboxylesterase|uniref:Alpha/beta hydrolase n=1 Tax=Limimaricola cinnabarinus TaxID=1125964 RepID=A0A2G1MJB5_9RHOB|nr:alpha/beta hydrolase [Limimaricola cinnabarinus]PHP28846.1 alpha/beta hydrolase [Limimaricola cinnabarinus]
MPLVTTKDQTQLYVKDWGEGRPVVLIHGWPLNSDSWEYQAVRLAESGHRVVAYDRRGFGRSGQPFQGYDYDTMADDLDTVMRELDLKDAAIVGFSMGGGEVARYMSRHEGRNVRAAGLIASVAPGMLKSDKNPDGVTADVFEGMKDGLRKDRPEFLREFFKGFYGNKVSEGVLHWSLMMAMQASPKATLDCVDAFGKTDFTDDMNAFGVPALVVHGAKDETVPADPSGRRAARLIGQKATLKEYDDAPHGLTATHADRFYEDLAAFLK